MESLFTSENKIKIYWFILGILSTIVACQIYNKTNNVHCEDDEDLFFDNPFSSADINPFDCRNKIEVCGNFYEDPHIELVQVMKPYQNLHDFIKELVLLEMHLLNPERRCIDCCRKHALRAQALLEEAQALSNDDPEKALPVPTDVTGMEKYMRGLQIDWEESDMGPVARSKYGCALRKLRKLLMPVYGKPLCR